MPRAIEPSWPLDPSLATSPLQSPPPFPSHPCPCPVPEDPAASAPSSTQPLPNLPKCTHQGTGEGSVGSSASLLLRGPAASPGTQTPGSRGGAAPCAGSGRGTASDWHVPPPGTPALGGREKGKGREGGKGGKKGRGSRREASGSIWGWTKSWSVPPLSTRASTLSLETEKAGHEEGEPWKAKSPGGERRRIQGDKHPHPLHTDWRHTHTHPHKGTLCFLGFFPHPTGKPPTGKPPTLVHHVPTHMPCYHMPASFAHMPSPHEHAHAPTHPPSHTPCSSSLLRGS